MIRRLVATYVVIAAVVLAVLEIPLAVVHESSQRQNLRQRVERDAVALAALVEDDLQRQDPQGRLTVRTIVDLHGRVEGVRMVVADRTGRVVADTAATPGVGRDFGSRPEIAQALTGRVATGERRSQTLGTDLMYVAVPVASGGEVHGAVRATVPMSRVDEHVRRYRMVLVGVAVAVLMATALAGLWIARWVSAPLSDLRMASRRIAAGNLTERADVHSGPVEVRELAGAFNDMVTRLDETLHAQEEFVADASHQLRSPLTALRLRIENLQYELPDSAQDDAEATLAEVDRLTRMVNGLLALARADRGGGERMVMDVSAVASERVDTWRPVAEEQDVEIVFSATGAASARLTDGALAQVVDNLIANALEASPANTTVSVHVELTGQVVDVTVADYGPGMDADARAHAFDRFWTNRPDRSGSGLGLAIVQRLVAADGGTIGLEENPGGGLAARVRYPTA